MAFVSRFSYALGSCCQTVDDAARAGLLSSPAEELRAAGFRYHHMSPPAETVYDLGRAAVDALGEGLRGRVDAIVWSSCLPMNAAVDGAETFSRTGDVRDLMDFPAARLQAALGLDDAVIVGLCQQGCTGLLGSIRLAAALLAAESGWDRVLCVTADRFPPGACYEQSYCLISDGAAACVVSRREATYRLVAAHHLANGALGRANADETLGAWFGSTHRLVTELLDRARTRADWVVPQNIHPAAWGAMSRMLDLDRDRVCADSRADVGHVISADNAVNLTYLERRDALRRGDAVLLTMAGYGMHWQGLVLEVVG